MVKIDFALKKVIQQVFIDYLWDNQWWARHELTSGRPIYIYTYLSSFLKKGVTDTGCEKNKIYIPFPTSKGFFLFLETKSSSWKNTLVSVVHENLEISLVLGRIVKWAKLFSVLKPRLFKQLSGLSVPIFLNCFVIQRTAIMVILKYKSNYIIPMLKIFLGLLLSAKHGTQNSLRSCSVKPSSLILSKTHM